MAHHSSTAADPAAPPITRELARFVATHPSRGWPDAIEREAHRTFVNWLACAVGAAMAGAQLSTRGRKSDGSMMSL